MFWLIKRLARNRDPVQFESRLEFRVFFVMKSLILFVLAVSAFGTLVTLLTAITDPTVPFYLPLGFLAMFAGSLLASPAPVVVDRSGMRQCYWWRRNKYIPWSEVVEAVREPRTGCTVVRGKWGTCISFSPYLVGQDRFEPKILAHSDLNEIPACI